MTITTAATTAVDQVKPTPAPSTPAPQSPTPVTRPVPSPRDASPAVDLSRERAHVRVVRDCRDRHGAKWRAGVVVITTRGELADRAIPADAYRVL